MSINGITIHGLASSYTSNPSENDVNSNSANVSATSGTLVPSAEYPQLKSRCKRLSCSPSQRYLAIAAIFLLASGNISGFFGIPRLVSWINGLTAAVNNDAVVTNYNVSSSTAGHNPWNASNTDIGDNTAISLSNSSTAGGLSSTGVGPFNSTGSGMFNSTNMVSSTGPESTVSSLSASLTGGNSDSTGGIINDNVVSLTSPNSISGTAKLLVGANAGQIIGEIEFYKRRHRVGTPYNRTYVHLSYGISYPIQDTATWYYVRLLNRATCPGIGQTAGNAPLWVSPLTNANLNYPFLIVSMSRSDEGDQTKQCVNCGLVDADFDLTALNNTIMVVDNEPYETYGITSMTPTGNVPALCAELRL